MTTDAQDDFFAYWGEVEVGFGARAPQNPVSIGLRLAFALPHLLVLVVLAAVSVVVAVVGWFAALKLGRLPRPIAVYQIRWLAYLTRVSAYLFLLVDAYPPFSLTASEYPVRVEVVPSRLSMPAVLFRWALLIPTFVIWLVSITGLLLASPIIWIITLVDRQMPPPPCFAATAAVIRYQTRFVAYAVMVTDEYPGRLFGDGEGGAERELRLVLSGDAKSVLIPILIFGAIAVSVGAISLAVDEPPDASAALSRLEDATTVFEHSTSRCPHRPDRFRCLERAEVTWSAAWQRYGQDIADGYPYASRKSRATALIGASTDVAIALWVSSRAKTDSAHWVAWQRVRKRITGFTSVLSSPHYTSH